METNESLMVYAIVIVIALLISYFIMKGAVMSAMRDYNRERYSNSDILIRLTKIVAEIAKEKGVPTEKVNEILNDKSMKLIEKEILTGKQNL